MINEIAQYPHKAASIWLEQNFNQQLHEKGLKIISKYEVVRNIRMWERNKPTPDELELRRMDQERSLKRFRTTDDLWVILKIIADVNELTVAKLRSKTRVGIIPVVRQVAMFMAHNYMKISATDNGGWFNRDHSTVLYSIKHVSEGLDNNDQLISTVIHKSLSALQAQGKILSTMYYLKQRYKASEYKIK